MIYCVFLYNRVLQCVYICHSVTVCIYISKSITVCIYISHSVKVCIVLRCVFIYQRMLQWVVYLQNRVLRSQCYSAAMDTLSEERQIQLLSQGVTGPGVLQGVTEKYH